MMTEASLSGSLLFFFFLSFFPPREGVINELVLEISPYDFLLNRARLHIPSESIISLATLLDFLEVNKPPLYLFSYTA
jgi:hypothetical protein